MAGQSLAATWPLLLEALCETMGRLDPDEPLVVLSSLPDLPYGRDDREGAAPLTFIQGPPGRNIAVAIGLRATRPKVPVVLLMNADSVTLGTNHLIHAARRNIGMTLVVLRADLTQDEAATSLDRTAWRLPDYQRRLETPSRPLDWMTALQASFVGRANLRAPHQLANLLVEAIGTPGFTVIGLTADESLETGVLSTHPWPEYFAAYREWAAPLANANTGTAAAEAAPARAGVPRTEVRIAGLGGQGVKLAGTVLLEAAGLHEGLDATQRGDYGSATRGGPSLVDVVMASEPISDPVAGHPDVLVLLAQTAADRYGRTVKPGAKVIVDPDEVARPPAGALPVRIAAIAREHTGKILASGVTALGCVAACGAISRESLEKSLGANVPRAAVASNRAACEAAWAATREAIEGGVHV